MMRWRIVPVLLSFIAAGAYFEWRNKAATEVSGPLTKQIATNKDKIELLVVGDFGIGNQRQLEVAAAMEDWCKKSAPEGLILLGDNIYMDGVSSVDDPLWKTIIETPLSSPCLRSLPIYPVLGNHDYKGNPNAQIEYSHKSDRWHLPSRFYAVKFDNLLELVAIDTNVFDFCFDYKSCSLDFLRHKTKHKSTKFQIIMGHHPAISSSVKYPETFQGRTIQHLVCDTDAYFAGHAHHFEHRQLEQCRAQIIVAGTGGADLSPTHDHSKSKFKISKHGFMSLTASADGLRYRFIDSKGQLLYDSENQSLQILSNIGGIR